MNLRIAMLVDKPLPVERPTGIGVRMFNLAKALSKLGVKVHFICKGKNKIEVVNDNLRIYKVKHFTKDHAKLVINLHGKERLNVVHTASARTIPAMLIVSSMRIPSLFHYAEVWKMPATKMITHKIMFALVDKVITVSRNTKNEIVKKFGVDERKIRVIYNGVDVEFFKPRQVTLRLKEEFGLENFSQIILTVGMLQKRKGQVYVIKSLPSILEQFPHCCYVNVGGYYSEEYKIQLDNIVKKLGLTKNVRFFPSLPHDKLTEFINMADVCIHPALHEGFSLALLEEMACEKPVVAFCSSSIPEIIEHRKNGVLVKTGDVDGLASAIIELLSDCRLSRALAENARKRVEEDFTWQKTAIEFLNVYEQMCKQKSS